MGKHLGGHQLERARARLDVDPRRSGPEDQPVEVAALAAPLDRLDDHLRCAHHVGAPRQIVSDAHGVVDLGEVAGLGEPLLVHLAHVEVVLLDVVPAALGVVADVDDEVGRHLANRPAGRGALVAVQLEHLHWRAGVGHEVGAEARRPPSGCWRRAADPQRRVRLLHRLGGDGDIVELEVPSPVAHPRRRPGGDQQLDDLVGARAPLRLRHAHHLELLEPVSRGDSQVEAPAAEGVDHGHVLGEAQRVVQRRQQYRRAEAHPPRAHGHRAEHRHQPGQVALVGEVVLGQPRRAEAEGVGPGDLLERLGVQRRRLAPPLLRVAHVVPDVDLHGQTRTIPPSIITT